MSLCPCLTQATYPNLVMDPQHEDGSRRMLVCLVTLGRIAEGSPGLRLPPPGAHSATRHVRESEARSHGFLLYACALHDVCHFSAGTIRRRFESVTFDDHRCLIGHHCATLPR